ncbi:phthalate 3,4-dioxygenase beta subunit [Actinomadura hallensis]|uniref:Phthalate 3,4-dioxygenase beta subunit n=1 Tax=Actinomadura hallensis TaxID=337895 RepID=A0A543ICS1_9ACTN|nr:3-phenylpropionate/cinnamic acid dioxygenase subunit beta [Actinomadura hallensis]TQM68357.1 phthalate 3,4-dioxygenase beta subunit [Actinomadura hallensis]
MTAHIPVDSADSPLGARATRAVAVGGPLPFTDPRHLAAHQWLVDETYLLDRQELDEWLARMTEDVHYYMPIRVTTSLGAGYDTARRMAHFDEDLYSLERRVARLRTGHAWTEDPPSRLRHHLSNVRTFATDVPGEILVESAVLLFRSRGDVDGPSLVSAGRRDVLRDVGGEWRLARRHITVDESVLRTQNLAVFL